MKLGTQDHRVPLVLRVRRVRRAMSVLRVQSAARVSLEQQETLVRLDLQDLLDSQDSLDPLVLPVKLDSRAHRVIRARLAPVELLVQLVIPDLLVRVDQLVSQVNLVGLVPAVPRDLPEPVDPRVSREHLEPPVRLVHREMLDQLGHRDRLDRLDHQVLKVLRGVPELLVVLVHKEQ